MYEFVINLRSNPKDMLLKDNCSKIKESYTLQKILLIEDDMATVEVLKYFFSMIGYDFLTIRTGTGLAELITNFRPGLIIVDYLLPTTNGADLCMNIKKNAETAAIPIIIYSAYPLSAAEIILYGCDAFIAKPFDLDDLAEKVEFLLQEASFKGCNKTCRYKKLR